MNKMKDFFRILMLTVVSLVTFSCTEDEVVEQSLEVTTHNLHGQWKLAEINGMTVPEETYVYIDFDRKGTYKMYQKQDSQYTRYITGNYSVTEDAFLGYILSGNYDMKGDWNHDYIVTDLMKEGTMTWTVRDDKADNKEDLEVQKFVRVDEIPADVLDAGRYDEEEE